MKKKSFDDKMTNIEGGECEFGVNWVRDDFCRGKFWRWNKIITNFWRKKWWYKLGQVGFYVEDIKYDFLKNLSPFFG